LTAARCLLPAARLMPCIALLCVADCLLVATNLDCADNIGASRMMPGTGGLVAAVEVASGRTAVGGPWRSR
jgi:hypothetical protein